MLISPTVIADGLALDLTHFSSLSKLYIKSVDFQKEQKMNSDLSTKTSSLKEIICLLSKETINELCVNNAGF